MKHRPPQPKRHSLPALALVLATVLATLACTLALPSRAQAFWPFDTRYIAYVEDSNGNKTYFPIWDQAGAVEAASCEGKTLVLIADWDLALPITVESGKQLTVDMNGHTLYYRRRGGRIFLLKSNSSLTVKSSAPNTQFNCRMYDENATGKTSYLGNITTGGLLVMGESTDGSAVDMESGSHLTLDGVAAVGDYCSYVPREVGESGGGGTIHARTNCTVNLKNGTKICHNAVEEQGGGIYVGGDNTTINIDDSTISNNRAAQGGGIYINGKNTTINLTNNASIRDNVAEAGGGIYCNTTDFTITSDNTGVIEGNKATSSDKGTTKGKQSGGGIHVDQKSGDNKGLIENLTIRDNYSAYDGGGLELDQTETLLRNCKITGNTCKFEGGGIYVCNSGNTIENCTITGNACDLAGENYEGGGIYVASKYDIDMYGKCTVTGNTRGKDSDNADDVFLDGGFWADAYITGQLTAGSSVGVRTGSTGTRQIAKDFQHAENENLFMNLNGYYVTYGEGNDKRAWQNYSSHEYNINLDGKVSLYRAGSDVTISVPAEKDGKVFWYWQSFSSSAPKQDYITGAAKRSTALAFRMPTEDIYLKPVYATRVTKATVTLSGKPEAGKALPTTATITSATGGDDTTLASKVQLPVTWRDDTGKVVSGTAKAGTTYQATICGPALRELGIYYSPDISTADVKVGLSENDSLVDAASAKVDATGTIIVTTPKFTTDGERETQPESSTGSIDVYLKKQGLLDAKEDADAETMALDDEAADSGASADSLGKIEVTYDKASEKVVIAAPHVDDYNFCYWDGVDESLLDDEDVVTLSIEDAEKISTLTAVYAPVATGLTVDLDAPVAGEALATVCSNVTATCSDGSEADFADAFDAKETGFKVTWSPEATDGKAAYSTTYTALIELSYGGDLEEVENTLATGATVTCNGVTATSAGFAVNEDGKLCLAVAFPATADKAEEPGDDSGKTDEDEKPGDTDADADADKGDESDAGTTDESDAGAATEANDAQVTTTVTTTTVAKAAKAGTPATGDAVSVAAPVALLAASAVCLAAARVSRRQR